MNLGMAELAIRELERQDSESLARTFMACHGDCYATYVAECQSNYLDEQLKANVALFKKFKDEYMTESMFGTARSQLEDGFLYTKPDEIDIGRYGRWHERWLQENYSLEYEKHVQNGDLEQYLARFNLLAETIVKTYMRYAMKYATKAVPDKASPEWEPYERKLRSQAELSQLRHFCIIREVVC